MKRYKRSRRIRSLERLYEKYQEFWRRESMTQKERDAGNSLLETLAILLIIGLIIFLIVHQI